MATRVFNYVILKVFYPLVLAVSYKFSIHFHPLGMEEALGWVIATLTLTTYALQMSLVVTLSVLPYLMT